VTIHDLFYLFVTVKTVLIVGAMVGAWHLYGRWY
jgi:hypothetical protein